METKFPFALINSLFSFRSYISRSGKLDLFRKPGVILILFFVLSIFGYSDSLGQTNTWDGSSGANWNTAANWSLNLVPLAAHDVVIPNGITATINVNTAAVCNSFTMNGGGTANTVSISAGNSLTVTNGITIGAGTGSGDHKILAVGSGTLSCASVTVAATVSANRNSGITLSTGTVTVTNSISMSTNDVFTFTGAGTLNVGGDMSGGTFTASTGTVVYNGAAQNGGVYTYNNLTLTGSNTKTFSTTPTVNGILSLEGTASVVVTTGVVTYGANATLRYNKSASYTTTDEEWVSPFTGTGGVIIANTGAITLNGAKQLGSNTNVPLNINTGATLSTSASNFTLTLHGDFINDGTFTAGSSAITIAGTTATHNIDGFTTTGIVSMTKTGGTATFAGNVNAGALTINGAGGTLNLGTGLTHAITGNWTRTAGTLNGGSSTLSIGGSVSGSGGTFTASSGTIDWNAGGPQTLANVTYNNLTLSGSGVKTLQTGTTIIGGDFVLSGTAESTAVVGLSIGGSVTLGSGTIFTAGSFTHNVGGDWTNDGATFNYAGSTVNFNGAAQSIGGSSSTTFNNLALAGSNTKTFNAATFTLSDFSISAGVVANLNTFTNHTANILHFGGAGQAAGTWGGTSSAATNINSTFFATATGILTVAVQGSTTYYSRQTGNWNATTSWSTVTYANATNTGTFPIAGDVVNIGGGAFTITVNVNSACASLNFQSGGNDRAVSLGAGITLDVSGVITLPTGSGFGDTNTLAVGAGILNAAGIAFSTGSIFGGHQLTISTGTATISGDVTQSGLSAASVVFSGAGLLRLGGAMPNYCSFTPSTGTVEYFGSVDQVISSLNSVLAKDSYYNLTISGAGVKTTAEDTDINGVFTLGAGTSFTAGAFTHTVAGNWINNGTTFNNTGSTISLDGGAQTIGGTTATAFNNLTLAGTNTKVLGFSTIMDGIFSINSGVVANLGSITTHQARALMLNGSGSISGTWGSLASAATNKDNTYFTAASTGIITITNRVYFSRQTGNWNASATWSTVTYGNATNLGAFPVAGDIVNVGGADLTITVNINPAACASLSFQDDADFSPIVTLGAGSVLNVSGAIDIPTAGNADANTLAVATGTLTAGSLSFSSSNTFSFGDHILTISSGTATINGDVTESGVLTNATVTFSGAGNLILKGAFLNSGSCTFTRSTGTVNYNSSTVAQTIGDFTYYNLTLNNTTASIPQLTLFDNTIVTNTLTMTSGVVNMAGNTLTLGAGTAASTLVRTASTSTNWMYGGSFIRVWPTAQTPSPTAGNRYGLFPLGHSTASSYRPVEITAGSNVTTSGSVTFQHVDASTATDLSPVYNDAGTNIVRKNDAQFIGATSGVAGGTNYTISVTMTDLLAGTASDIRLAVSNGSTTVTNVGTHVANSGTAPNPTVGRSGLSVANLSGDFRITTTNSTNTPLPVTLISFNAKLNNDVVNLDWTTASELNNDFFTVERATNLENFEEIEMIDGNGTTNQRLDYYTVDPTPAYGRSYYRLRQTDFDGKFTYSDLKVIDYEGPRFATLRVYPNPSESTSKLTLLVTGLKTQTSVPVAIYNVQGQLVYSDVLNADAPGTFRKEVEFTNTLRAGVYFIRAGETLQLTQKLIIH